MRPARTGLLEVLRLLCATAVVFMLWQPEWRRTVEPAKQPEIVILWDSSGSMTTADAQLPVGLSPRREVVAREDMVNAILDTEFWKPLEEGGKNRVSVEPFSPAPDSDDPMINALAVTDIYTALSDLVDTRPDLRAVIMIGDGDWNATDKPAPVAAAQKIRLKDIPLFSVVTGSEVRLPDLDLRPAPDVITMDEKPGAALRAKPQASIPVGIGCVSAGDAGAFISMGNTGAVVGAATLGLRTLEGIRRPGLAITTHVTGRPVTVLDMGANVVPKPSHLLHYALMGSTLASDVDGVENPRVGLLNVGSESNKGTDLLRAAHSLLSESPINFVGNVEADGIFRSEERRVGKECRSRWSPYHQKKNT